MRIAMNVLQELEQEQIAARTKERPVPDFAPGDTLRAARIQEKRDERARMAKAEDVAQADDTPEAAE
jgi:ribosomal protein L19